MVRATAFASARSAIKCQIFLNLIELVDSTKGRSAQDADLPAAIVLTDSLHQLG
jgi:hypothetical protein